MPLLEGLFYDLRLSLRTLCRDKAFSLAAIAMLALAIGLNATVFAIMNTMLFRGFPLVQENDALVYIQERLPSGRTFLSYLDFEDWRSQANAFEGIAYVADGPHTFSDAAGRSIDALAADVSTNTFRLLRVSPMLGRDFVPADEVHGAPVVVILNYRLWEHRFNKRPDIVGLNIHINGDPATIIGVMPPGFDFPAEFSFWVPLTHTADLLRRGPATGRYLGYLAFGRLRPGMTLQQARAELETINRNLETVSPATNRGALPVVQKWSQFFVGPAGSVIYGSLWAAVWFVLLIACANLANLGLARTIGKSKDLSTRIALGASQVRMVRHILMDGIVLAAAAGIIAWWITKWSVRAWAVATASRFLVLDYTIDGTTLAYLVGVCVLSACVFSLAPAAKVLQFRVVKDFKGDAFNVRGTTQSLRAKRLGSVLVGGQMALAMVLLAGAGVLVHSLLNIMDGPSGVRNPQTILVGSIGLPSDKYKGPASRIQYFDQLETQLTAVPGVEAASVATVLPIGALNLRSFEIEGRPSPSDGGDAVQVLAAGSNYFRVLEASAISGRDFNDADQMTGVPVAIVNQSFAARFLSGEEPLGKRLRTTDRNGPDEWRTVVGVVPNIMQGDATREHFKPLIYVPFRQQPAGRTFFLVRTAVPPNQVAQAVRAEIHELEPDAGLADFRTLKASFAFDRDNGMDIAHAELGKEAAVAPILAMVALLLAAVGLYAVIAHSISQRVKEIGVRMAIGATQTDIRQMVLREGLLPVLFGMSFGLAAALAVNNILRSQLVGISPYDPVSMAGAPIVLILIAVLACLVPARWALSIDPATALRHD
jgi:putative ABC transport system permease protein